MNFDHSRRLLFGALLISLLLHLLLVFGWGRARALPPVLPQSVFQIIVSARPVAAPTSPPAVAEKVVPAATKRPKSVPLARQLAVSPAPSAENMPMPAGQVLPEMVASHSLSGPAKVRPENERGSERGSERSSEGVSIDGLRQYRIELAGAARRFRHYPALARTRGWEGVAEITVLVNAGVPSPSVKLVKSSGHGVLDEQALDMLSRAMAVTPLPESLHGRSFEVPMPIRFSLEE